MLMCSDNKCQLGPCQLSQILLPASCKDRVFASRVAETLMSIAHGCICLALSRIVSRQGCLLVYQGKPVWDGSGAVQAQVGQLQAVQKPLQDVQHRGPLAEDERVVPLFLQWQWPLSHEV